MECPVCFRGHSTSLLRLDQTISWLCSGFLPGHLLPQAKMGVKKALTSQGWSHREQRALGSGQAELWTPQLGFGRNQKGIMNNYRFETKLVSLDSLLYPAFCWDSNSVALFQKAAFLGSNLSCDECLFPLKGLRWAARDFRGLRGGGWKGGKVLSEEWRVWGNCGLPLHVYPSTKRALPRPDCVRHTVGKRPAPSQGCWLRLLSSRPESPDSHSRAIFCKENSPPVRISNLATHPPFAQRI